MSNIILESLLATSKTVSDELTAVKKRHAELLATATQLDLMIFSLRGKPASNLNVITADRIAVGTVVQGIAAKPTASATRPVQKTKRVPAARMARLPESMTRVDLSRLCVDILAEYGPQTLVELQGHLRDLGVPLPGPDGKKTLTNAFFQTGLIHSLPRTSTFLRAQYWIKDRPLPEGFKPRELSPRPALVNGHASKED